MSVGDSFLDQVCTHFEGHPAYEMAHTCIRWCLEPCASVDVQPKGGKIARCMFRRDTQFVRESCDLN